jgi:PAS domain-containing protein
VVYTQQPGEPSLTTYVSPQIEAMQGYTPQETMSDPEHWTKTLHPDDRERVLAEDERTNRTGEPFVAEYRQFAKTVGSCGCATRPCSCATRKARPSTGRASCST